MPTRKNFPGRKEARRESAKVRQAEYSQLTPEQKLKQLPSTGAKRQRELLTAKIVASALTQAMVAVEKKLKPKKERK